MMVVQSQEGESRVGVVEASFIPTTISKFLGISTLFLRIAQASSRAIANGEGVGKQRTTLYSLKHDSLRTKFSPGNFHAQQHKYVLWSDNFPSHGSWKVLGSSSRCLGIYVY